MRTNSILIVDDDEKLCALLKSYFEQEQFIVYVAHDGMTALHTLRNQKPQIMLLDLMMPGMDGFEVCRRIRQFSDIPIIFLSAKDDETDRLVGLNMGGDDYVTKPFNVDELMGTCGPLPGAWSFTAERPIPQPSLKTAASASTMIRWR